MKYVLSIDQGTTGTKALVLDAKLAVRGRGMREFPQHFPRPGQVVHELEDIWRSVVHAIRAALRSAGAKGGDIAAIGITNQRETTAIWDRATGAPAARAIVWQDRRTSDRCAALKEQGHEEAIRRRTGLVVDPYFSATKMEWLLRHVKGARARARKGQLALGTIDSFLVHRLSGGDSFVTDASNASRTMLMDLARMRWDDELLELFGVPRAALPEIRGSSEVVGVTAGVPGLPDGIPIAGLAGDQQAALFGQGCFDVGDSKCTYGTGAFLLMNVGDRPVRSQAGLLSTVAWKLADGERAYALEGSSFTAGASVQWLRDGLGLIRRSADVEALARSVEDSRGLVFVPALAGLGAPHWRPEARGLLAGIDRGVNRGHVARAVLEGIALEIMDLARAMEADAGRRISTFTVDGGASANDLLLQIQADLLRVPVVRPRMVETTALGAAFLAGLAVGFWPSKAALKKAARRDRVMRARMSPKAREKLVAGWRDAVAKA
ncbi:MAG TPA: glycerol kinase GlpK [Vulgatibacter sp.]|nr:glycerol kinase GlpK [Vulgatibacter sp.]